MAAGLDALIAGGATHRPRAAPTADVLTILRLSLYQMLHLDRVPASAVVDDAVDLARAGAARAAPRASSTRVLRRCSRQRATAWRLPPRPEAAATVEAALAYLGITHSHPDWLVARWLDRYGFDARGSVGRSSTTRRRR